MPSMSLRLFSCIRKLTDKQNCMKLMRPDPKNVNPFDDKETINCEPGRNCLSGYKNRKKDGYRDGRCLF